MKAAGLTLKDIAELPPSTAKTGQLHADGKQPNLYLLVLPSGTKTWMLRERTDGRWHVASLGRLERLNPAQARLAAQATSAKRREGGAVEVSKMRVGEAAALWYQRKRVGKFRRPEQVKQYLDRDLKTIAEKPLAKVTHADLEAILLEKRKTAPIATNKLRVILNHFFGYATENDWIVKNPMRMLTFDEVGTPTEPRKRTLSDDEIRAAWNIEPPHGSLYQMLLATGQRLTEVLALATHHDMVRDGVWHIPKEMTKAGRAHAIPMMPLMVDILDTGIKPKRRAAAHHLWRKAMPGEDAGTWATQHDIRRTVGTRMASLGVPESVIEALLNHARPRIVRTYQQADQLPAMRDALDTWHAELLRIVTS